MVEPKSPQMTVTYGNCVCMLDNGSDRHELRVFNTSCFFKTTIVMRTRINITCLLHCQYFSKLNKVILIKMWFSLECLNYIFVFRQHENLAQEAALVYVEMWQAFGWKSDVCRISKSRDSYFWVLKLLTKLRVFIYIYMFTVSALYKVGDFKSLFKLLVKIFPEYWEIEIFITAFRSLLILLILRHVNPVNFLKSYLYSYSIRTCHTPVTIGKALMSSITENCIKNFSIWISFPFLSTRNAAREEIENIAYISHVMRNLKLYYHKFSWKREARFSVSLI